MRCSYWSIILSRDDTEKNCLLKATNRLGKNHQTGRGGNLYLPERCKNKAGKKCCLLIGVPLSLVG